MRLDWEGSEGRFVRFARGEENGTSCFKMKSLKAPTFWWGYFQVIPPLVNWFETLWKIFYLGRGFLIFTHPLAPKHFSGSQAAYQDLSTRYDWSVKKSHCSIGPSGWREMRKSLPVIPWRPVSPLGPQNNGSRRCFTDRRYWLGTKDIWNTGDPILVSMSLPGAFKGSSSRLYFVFHTENHKKKQSNAMAQKCKDKHSLVVNRHFILHVKSFCEILSLY